MGLGASRLCSSTLVPNWREGRIKPSSSDTTQAAQESWHESISCPEGIKRVTVEGRAKDGGNPARRYSKKLLGKNRRMGSRRGDGSGAGAQRTAHQVTHIFAELIGFVGLSIA